MRAHGRVLFKGVDIYRAYGLHRIYSTTVQGSGLSSSSLALRASERSAVCLGELAEDLQCWA